MNTIEIVNDKIINSIDDTINVSLEEKTVFFDVKTIKINILKDTNLFIKINNDELKKMNIIFNVKESVDFNLLEINNSIVKTQYIFDLEANSTTFVFKFNDIIEGKERTIINLKGINAKIDYNFKTISKTNEEYDYIINHKANNTESNVNINGVNILDGLLSFNITGDVPKGILDCVVNENSRIINFNDNTCVIKPNLLIEEYSVSANHSALIGSFSKDELFYLQSRGIPKDLALNLLVKGFLTSNISIFSSYKEEIEKIINKYWR